MKVLDYGRLYKQVTGLKLFNGRDDGYAYSFWYGTQAFRFIRQCGIPGNAGLTSDLKNLIFMKLKRSLVIC